jgi:3-hydroxyacyl-[acyl-carrier-protein] dehydratase
MMTESKIPNTELPIDIYEILKYIPHRYPFLLVDRVVDFESGKRISVLKNVTINEHFFMGHFPNYPVMPGVLIIEAMAQSAGMLTILTNGPHSKEELYFFAAVNNAKFKRQVIPGDTLIFDIELSKSLRGVSIYKANARVSDKVVAIAEITLAKKGI